MTALYTNRLYYEEIQRKALRAFKTMRSGGIEPPPTAWKAAMIPFHHERQNTQKKSETQYFAQEYESCALPTELTWPLPGVGIDPTTSGSFILHFSLTLSRLSYSPKNERRWDRTTDLQMTNTKVSRGIEPRTIRTAAESSTSEL